MKLLIDLHNAFFENDDDNVRAMALGFGVCALCLIAILLAYEL